MVEPTFVTQGAVHPESAMQLVPKAETEGYGCSSVTQCRPQLSRPQAQQAQSNRPNLRPGKCLYFHDLAIAVCLAALLVCRIARSPISPYKTLVVVVVVVVVVIVIVIIMVIVTVVVHNKSTSK